MCMPSLEGTSKSETSERWGGVGLPHSCPSSSGGPGMSAEDRQGTHTAPSTAKYRRWYACGHLAHMCSFQETWADFLLFFHVTCTDEPQDPPSVNPQLIRSKGTVSRLPSRNPGPCRLRPTYAVYRVGSTRSTQEGFLLVSQSFKRNVL